MPPLPLPDDDVASLGRVESPPLRECLAEGDELTTSLATSLGGKQNSLGDDDRLQSLWVAPTSTLSGRSRESLDDRCSLEGRWNSRGDATRHAPPGSSRSLEVDAGSLAGGDARSPATSRPPCNISAHGLRSWPGDAFRGTSGPCTTAILRLGTACRGGAQGSPPEATGAPPPPPSGPFMARPPASPSSSRVGRAAITTGHRRFTACCCWESWEEGLLLDMARGLRRARSPSSSTRCCGRPGRGVVSWLRRRPRRGRTHRRLTHGHRHHSRARAQG